MATYYISLRGKRTTITVDDTLAAYLVLKIGGFALIGPRAAREHVGKWIRKRIKKEQSEVPEKNVSQWVQARILQEIVAPELKGASPDLVRVAPRS